MPSTELSPTVDIRSLYSDHHGWLKNWLRARLGCSETAADLAHDTYLRLLVSGTLPPIGESRRYLTRIAKGLVIDRYRRHQIEMAYLETVRHLPEPEAPGPEVRQMVIETLVGIDTMLQGLPEKVRSALLMRQLDGMSYREIATALGVSVSSVEKYVARALAACYQSLQAGSS